MLSKFNQLKAEGQRHLQAEMYSYPTETAAEYRGLSRRKVPWMTSYDSDTEPRPQPIKAH